jgi:hypothetical protein
MKTKKELKIDYRGLICRCGHPIIWQSTDNKGIKRKLLEHINLEQYGATKIIIISKDCWCDCREARD